MKEIQQRINQMSSREFVERAKEALAYCKEHKLLTQVQLSQPNKVHAANLAIFRMLEHQENQKAQQK